MHENDSYTKVAKHNPGQPASALSATQPPLVLKGLTPIGGRYWRCVSCAGTVEAACECCEPPACNCKRAAA